MYIKFKNDLHKMVYRIVTRIWFFITVVSSSGVPSLFLYPVLDKILIQYKPAWLLIKEMKVGNIGTSNFTVNVNSTIIKLPDDTLVTLSLYRQNNDKYSLFGRKIQHKICDYIKNDKLFYPDILKHSNYPSSCPIGAKDYQIRNYRMDFKNLASVMPIGHYKISGEMTSGKELGFSVMVYIRAVQQSIKGFGLKKTEEETEIADADVVLTEL